MPNGNVFILTALVGGSILENTQLQEKWNELKQLKSRLYSALENLTEALCLHNVLLHFYITCTPLKGAIP